MSDTDRILEAIERVARRFDMMIGHDTQDIAMDAVSAMRRTSGSCSQLEDTVDELRGLKK